MSLNFVRACYKNIPKDVLTRLFVKFKFSISNKWECTDLRLEDPVKLDYKSFSYRMF